MIRPVAVVIPAFQAGHTIRAVLRGVRLVLPDATIIVVDDGSTDGTRAAACADSDVTLAFERNRGKGAALRLGFAEALSRGAAAVLTLDADGQHEPAHAPLLLDALERADLIIGSRTRSGSMPIRRRFTNVLASAAVSAIVGERIADSQSGYRALRRVVLERVQATGERFELETDLLIRVARADFRIGSVPIPTVYGPSSRFRPFRDSARVVATIWKHRTASRAR